MLDPIVHAQNRGSRRPALPDTLRLLRWRYEADIVAHAIAEATNKTAGYALPRSFFWPATRRGVLALAGPAATVVAPTSEAFTREFNARRRWALRLAVLLQRTAADPRAPCDAPWIVTDSATGHRGQGYNGRWATPGWPWPFIGGVGVIPSKCRCGVLQGSWNEMRDVVARTSTSAQVATHMRRASPRPLPPPPIAYL